MEILVRKHVSIPFCLTTISIITEIRSLKIWNGSRIDLNVNSGSCSGSNLKYWLRLLLQPKMQTPTGVHSGAPARDHLWSLVWKWWYATEIEFSRLFVTWSDCWWAMGLPWMRWNVFCSEGNGLGFRWNLCAEWLFCIWSFCDESVRGSPLTFWRRTGYSFSFWRPPTVLALFKER